MRIALAAIFQVTNTFSRQRTTFDAFSVGPRLDLEPGRCDPTGTDRLAHELVQAGIDRDITVLPIMHATARSSGLIPRETVADLSNQLRQHLVESGTNLDALILMLSGTMVTEDSILADQTIVQVARDSLAQNTPIVAIFSAQANLSQDIVDSVDLAVCYQVGNHVSTSASAGKIMRLTESLVRKQIHPTSAFRHLRLLVSRPQHAPSVQALASAKSLSQEFEGQSNVLNVSLFPGFPYADIDSAGFSVVVTTDNDIDKANNLAQRLQMSIWDRREEFVTMPANVEIVVHDAMLAETGPVIIVDLGDDPSAGGAGDGTGLLWALIDLGALDSALGVIVDPGGVSRAIEAGVGNKVNLDIGGSIDHRSGYPINVTATVRKISDGRLMLDDHCQIDLGRVVVLDVDGRHGGQIDVVLTEKAPDAIEPALFAALGVDIATKKIVGVKSSLNVQASYASMASKILDTSTPGITTPVLAYFDYQRLVRPIYPLDAM